MPLQILSIQYQIISDFYYQLLIPTLDRIASEDFGCILMDSDTTQEERIAAERSLALSTLLEY